MLREVFSYCKLKIQSIGHDKVDSIHTGIAGNGIVCIKGDSIIARLLDTQASLKNIPRGIIEVYASKILSILFHKGPYFHARGIPKAVLFYGTSAHHHNVGT